MAQKCNPLTDFKDFHFFKIEPGGFFVIKTFIHWQDGEREVLIVSD